MKQQLQGFYRLYEKALQREQAGLPIIKLHVGATMLPVPEAALRVFRGISSGASPYVSSSGIMPLRVAAAERENCSPEEIVIGPGSKFLIYALMHLLKKSGRYMIVPQPAWPAYGLMAEDLGLAVRYEETGLKHEWELGKFELDGACMALVCNPLNPTSTCYSSAFMQRLVVDTKVKGIPLIIDEAYRDLAFQPIERYPAIRVRSFSKEFNMEGMRLGYAVVPADLGREMSRFMQLSVTCTSAIIQEAGSACLREGQTILDCHRQIWKSRLTVLGQALRGTGFEFVDPQAGMYVFARHPGIVDSESFCERLFERGVAVAPGTAFGPYQQFLRFAASAEGEVLLQAVKIIEDTLRTDP